MATSELIEALQALAHERKIDEFYLIERLEQSLAKSYERILDLEWDARVTIDRQTGKIYVYELVPVGEPDEETGEYSEFEERDVTPDDVSRIARGEQARPAIVVSRTHPDLIRRLFEIEVPEIYEGVVEIKSVAREPGARSKVAVFSREANLDPVGACVGPKGSRVRMVVEELRNERVDVIQWSPDPAVYVANALSPAKVSHVSIDEDNNYATVIVPDDQLSLAIGKEGQNARLAARLTGWHIDIKPQSFQGASLVDVEMDDEVEEDDGFCIFVDEDGNRCRNHARPNSQYCGVHADAEAEA